MNLKSSSPIRWVGVATLLALMSAFAVTALGQNTYGTLVGRVSDAQDAVIPGAMVTATNQSTNIARSVQTGATGDYSVLSLLPGMYDVSVEMDGFKKTLIEGINLRVNESVRIDVALEIGDVVETIEVSSSVAPLLETTRSTLGTVVANEKVVELPLNGRDMTQLTMLLPGASPGASAGGFFIIGGQTVAVTGNRSDQNNYTLDGVNNNETFFKHYGIRPSLDAIQEFTVQTNITSAEFGDAAGANVNVAIKSGTNEIHGSLFEFFRNDKLDARTFFAPERAAFRWNQFGAAVGGPVVRNRTFWFANWESFRFRRESTILSSVPTQEMREGRFLTNIDGSPIGQLYDLLSTQEGADGMLTRQPFDNNTIPQSRFHQLARTWQEGVYGPFLPNQPGQAPNFINTTPDRRDDDQVNLRLDHQVSDNNNFFVRWSWADNENLSPQSFPGREVSFFNKFRNMAVSDTHVFSPKSIFDFKFGYNSDNIQRRTDPLGLGQLVVGSPAMFREDFDFPIGIGITGFAGAGLTAFVSGPQRTWQFMPSFTQIAGKHTIKIGADIKVRHVLHDGVFANVNHDKIPTSDPQDTVGVTGYSYASFLLGFPSSGGRIQPLEAPGCSSCTEANMKQDLTHIYFQDDYKMTRNLTLNLGLRYEWTSWYSSRNDPPNASWFDAIGNQFVFAGPNPITGEPANTTPTFIVPDKNNWAPRFGFAYLLGQRTTVRGGYSLFYGSNIAWEGNHMRGNFPFALGQNFASANKTVYQVSSNDPFPALDPSRPSAQHTARRDNVMPYVQQWNLGVQRQLADDLMWEVNYVGSKGTRLSSFIDGNNALPGPPADGDTIQQRRPYPMHTGAFSENQSDAVSSYHGLTTKLEKRFSQGLSYRLNYAWSKSMDLNSQWGGTSAQNALDARSSIGLSDFHRAHIFSADMVWRLPRLQGLTGALDKIVNDWQINTIIQLRSGSYLTPTLTGDHNNVAGRGTGQRPDLAGSEIRYLRTPERWVDPASFALPNLPEYVGDESGFGTAGRNIIEGPGHAGVDFSLYKNVPITEHLGAQLRFEFFNIFNRVNFNNPGTGGWDPSNFASWGRITGTGDARQIQIAAKFYF